MPATYARTALMPTYRRNAGRVEPRAWGAAERVLRAETAAGGAAVYDYSAADVTKLPGVTPATWPARRGGLPAAVLGTPTVAAPDSDLNAPSVAFGTSGDGYNTAGALDWSSRTVATLLSVSYCATTGGANVRSPGAVITAPGQTASNGGLALYYFDEKATGIHKADGAGGFVFERDADADTGQARVLVTAHNTAAAASDEIRLYLDGTEETGTQSGSSGGNPWYAAMNVALGYRGGNTGESLGGRLARFIVTTRLMPEEAAVRCSAALQVINRLP